MQLFVSAVFCSGLGSMKSNCAVFPRSSPFCAFPPPPFFSSVLVHAEHWHPTSQGLAPGGPADGWTRVPALSLVHSNPESRAGVPQVPRARYGHRSQCHLQDAARLSSQRPRSLSARAQENTAEPRWLAGRPAVCLSQNAAYGICTVYG